MIGEELGSLKAFVDTTKPAEQQFASLAEYNLDLEASRGKFVFKKKGLLGKELTVELAFPTFHGSYGEDGTFQGLCEMLGVPYVGSGVAASAIAMDKALTKQICKAEGVPITEFVYFTSAEWRANKASVLATIRKQFTGGVVVKPVHLGSSIGITKVKDLSGSELEDAVELAATYDTKVLVEETVSPLMDVTCCIIGNSQLTASELQESVFSAAVLDFEEKYLKDGGTQTGGSSSVVIPARLPDHVTMGIKEMAKRVYRALGCTGISRVDFLYNTETMMFYANEVNPLPGTLYEHLWKKSGVETQDLVERLLGFAREEAALKAKVSYTFDSPILTALSGSKLTGSKLSK
jgi:D-alanine-D-alanine ligase